MPSLRASQKKAESMERMRNHAYESSKFWENKCKRAEEEVRKLKKELEIYRKAGFFTLDNVVFKNKSLTE